MTFITWFLRLIIVSFLVVFALQNTDQVTLRVLPELLWQAPLVIFLLVFFVAGALMGVLSVAGVMYRQRREISRLKRSAAVNPPEKPISELPPVT